MVINISQYIYFLEITIFRITMGRKRKKKAIPPKAFTRPQKKQI